MSDRTTNTLRNTMFGIGGYIVSLIMNFIGRTVFINILGATYLGINGLFSNIISILSLAELGIGAAIAFSMYEPIAEKNNEKLKSLMKLYSTSYKIIGISISVFGVALIPFLKYFIRDMSIIPHISLIYLLFLAGTVSSYFFAYKRTIIVADQKKHIDTLNSNIFSIIMGTLQVGVLLLTRNYYYYLIIQILCNILSNIQISRTANKLYPFLRERDIEPIDGITRKTIVKNIKALFLHNLGGVVVVSTDNILISYFIGINVVGIYSNYILIMGIVNNVINQFFNSVVASVGNLNASENRDKSYRVFKILNLVTFWTTSFSSISLFVLFNPFISLWVGDNYTFNMEAVAIIILNFYFTNMRKTVQVFKNTYGLFWQDRYKPVFESAINFTFSIMLLKIFGLIGVFVGTAISLVLCVIWVEPYVLFKYGFKLSFVKYMMKYLGDFLLFSGTLVVTNYICNVFTMNGVQEIIYKGLVCMIVPNVVFFVFYLNTDEFKELSSRIRAILLKLGSRHNQ